ncbi:TMEM175 family protein [Enterococcus rivorum]|uniref:DUF1211 domain-containing membrane protein n=1 Tax=Enterococcus rivorum TaxID=762845 RepID=A0A1E5L036_9ENTE|nr:TMEM175 family protein [Enterococcus rivorum]MBP2100212.1 putative membrane protein [Enterococcus rivorum]OEH83434.1 hypothetical protein BCR26_09635 [Enterococcus rivorum]
MSKGRIEIFTDGVVAIVMTLLVLELKQPKEGTWQSLLGVERHFIIYIVSFVMLAIYWNNHHHMFQLVHKVDGRVLWANNFFLFTLTLFPFTTAWVGEFSENLAPQITYGMIMMLANISYLILTTELIRVNGNNSELAKVFENQRKSYLSIGLNVLGLFLGWYIHPYLVLIVNIVILLMWFIPDKRIEKHYK